MVTREEFFDKGREDIEKVQVLDVTAPWNLWINVTYLAALANLARAALRREAVFFFKRPFLTALSYSD